MLCLMNRLPPDVLAAFNDGLCVAKLSEGPFNAVWADYALEVTENKALKGTGGIIGLILKGTALETETAKYSMIFQNELHRTMKPPQDVHHTDNPSHKIQWDNA